VHPAREADRERLEVREEEAAGQGRLYRHRQRAAATQGRAERAEADRRRPAGSGQGLRASLEGKASSA